MLKILLPDSSRDTDYLAQMHHLRYKRFVVQFGWKEGVHAISQMEFDCFDNSAPLYLVNIGEDNRVDTAIRLIQTTQPNYTLNAFAENTTMVDDERAHDIIELSCTCNDAQKAQPNGLSLLMTGLLEVGVASKIRHYISTTNQRVQSMTDKLGWPAKEISERVTMDDQSFVALQYAVDKTTLDHFHRMNGISENLLSHEEINRCQLKQRALGTYL